MKFATAGSAYCYSARYRAPKVSIRKHKLVAVIGTGKICIHRFGQSYPVHTPNLENDVGELGPILHIARFVLNLWHHAEIRGSG